MTATSGSSARFPFSSFAFGWFQILYSDELDIGDLLRVRYFGRELVAWRAQDGTAHVMGAYCPHLGAHIGYGGEVVDCQVRCPFHGWVFGVDGRCAGVPYSSGADEGARMDVYPTEERNGLVLAWFHPNGIAPLWDIPELAECTGSDFVRHARYRWRIRTVWQEIGENLYDMSHLNSVHALRRPSRLDVKDHGYHRSVVLSQPFDTPLGPRDGTIEAENYGPGIALSRFSGNVGVISTVTPIDHEFVDVRFEYLTRWLGTEKRTRRVGGRLVRELVRQFEHDIPIWENKRYVEAPPLVRGEEQIKQWRSWARQFHVGDKWAMMPTDTPES